MTVNMRHPVGSELGMYPLKVFTPRSPLCDRTPLTIIKDDLTCWKRITIQRLRRCTTRPRDHGAHGPKTAVVVYQDIWHIATAI